MKFLWKVLEQLSPESEFSGGSTYESIICVKGVMPSLEEVKSKNAELQAEYDAVEYQRQRAAEYPSWQDQLDTIYHKGIDAWKAEIKAIKDKYPK